MPSIKSKLLRGTMKSVKPIITGMNIPDQRKGMDLLRYIHPLPKAVAIRPAEADCPLKGQWAMPEDAVARKIAEIDEYRAKYYKHHTGSDWYDARNYDLSLNSGVLGFDGVVEEIVQYMQVRSQFQK